MRKFIREWGIVLLIGILLGTMPVMAFAVGNGNKIESRSGFWPITWELMNSTGATTAYEHPAGKSSVADCTFTATGSDVKTVYLQSSKDGISFVNATVGIDILNTNSESLSHVANIIGGPWFQLWTADADFGVLNTVTGACDIGNPGNSDR